MNILPDSIKRFMPLHQQRIVASSDEFKEVIERLDREINQIPNRNEKNIVYAHFFYAGCDWFIKEWDREENLLFGYAILNQDLEMSEYGYIELSDLVEDGRVELDFYWEPCSMEKALYDKYPSYFPKP